MLTEVDKAVMESTLQGLRVYFYDETDQAGRNSELACSLLFPNVNDFGKLQNNNTVSYKSALFCFYFFNRNVFLLDFFRNSIQEP